MSLQDKSLHELTELKVTLLKRIQGNPDHSGIERVELEDIETWIALRVREQEAERLKGPTFDAA